MDNYSPEAKKSFYSIYVKRLLDISLCSVALLTLSPLLFLVAALELVYHGRPVLYASIRPGKACRPIKIYKFRSMTNERDDNGVLLPEE